ncbi:hypothetical protein GJ496_000109 [Pomphorhynchus laevis]|nr:hypothetical protein GJ496_000109 [Pomphorhynchus laevis]
MNRLNCLLIAVGKRFSSGVAAPLCKIDPFKFLRFTCKRCDTQNEATFHSSSYTDGVVLVRCSGCSNYHVIADNCNWFSDLNGKRNIEDIVHGVKTK